MGRFQRISSPAELEARDAARAAKLEALHGTLTEQIAALRTGTDWQRWLTVAARFHNYSFNNVLLIAAQRPGATAVAGYEAWKALGRQVDKGERGIQILAPIVRRASSPDMAGDDTTTAAATAADTTGSNDSHGGQTTGSGLAPRRVAGFRVAHVFDVDQTNGEPLPERPAPVLLAGQAPPGLWDALAAQVHAGGFALERGPCLSGAANGVTNYATRTVTVRADVDEAQAVKTLAHELAHVLLHDPTGPATIAGPTDPSSAQPASSAGHCRGRIEVEAESVAFLVTSSHGLDSGAYTFAYVAGWAGSVDAAEPETVVRTTGQRVLTAAHAILTVTQELHAPAAATAPALTVGQQQADIEHGLAGRVHHAAEQTAALAVTAANTEQTLRSIGAGARHTVPGDGPHPVTAKVRQQPSGPGGRHAPERLAQVHELATAFYRSRLSDAAGDGCRAVEVLAERGVDAVTAVAEGLGYAPRAWTRLVEALRADGVSDGEMLAAGLAIPTARGTLVDRFRDRLIFPVRDGAGRTVALLGRAVDPTATDRSGQPVPKYLNSPDSDLYRKRNVLYGLDQAGRAALAAGAVPVLVEGPMDVRAVNLAGTAVTAPGDGPDFVGVAPCGTALTEQQVAVLDAAAGGLADRGVVVGLDGDAAGRAAAVRAFESLRGVGAWPHALDLPAGQDPAGLLQQHGPAGVHAALRAAGALPLADLVIDERLDRYNDQLHWAEGQIAAGRAAAAVVATLPPDQIGRQIVRLVTRLDLPAGEVSDLVVDAVIHPSRHAATRPTASHSTAAIAIGPPNPEPPAELRESSQPAAPPVPTAAQRARAGFPAPLSLQPPGSVATPPQSAARGAAAPPVRRHA